MTDVKYLALAALLMASAAKGQQPLPQYSFRAILTSDSMLDHHLGWYPTVHALAINDSLEVAFVVTSLHINGVFTTRQRVAATGDIIDGRYVAIDAEAYVAINGSGDVAYEAWFSPSKEKAEAGVKTLGIFINDRLAVIPKNGGRTEFNLTDEGWIVPRPTAHYSNDTPFSSCPSTSKHAAVFPVDEDDAGFSLWVATPITK